jgi:hypothetical protein
VLYLWGGVISAQFVNLEWGPELTK